MFMPVIAQDSDLLSALIFIVITAIFGVIGYLKKKASDQQEKDRTRLTEDEADEEIFSRYIAGEGGPVGTPEDQQVPISYEEKREIRARRRRRKRRTRVGLPVKESPATISVAVEDEPEVPLEMAYKDIPFIAPVSVAAGKKTNLIEALPEHLSPNQKAIVLMEVLGKPKSLTDF